jgi:hypothetical protein
MAMPGVALRGFNAWLSRPASLLDDWWRAIRPGRRAELALSGDGRTLRVVSGPGAGRTSEELVLSGDGEGPLAANQRLSELAPGRRVSVFLPPAWIIERRIELPLEAAGHLPGIVASRLNALSPLPREEVLHGHRIVASDRNTGRMNVALAILPRAKAKGIQDALSRAGAREIELRAPLADGETITLAAGQGGARGATGARRLLAVLLLLSIAGAGSALAYRVWEAGELATQRANLELRAMTARERITAAIEPVTPESLPEQVALELKEGALSIIGTLENLAAALPLDAYATEISIDNGSVRVSGHTRDLPGVLTSLESSGHFVDSRLVGTATRTEDDGVSNFVVQTRPLIRAEGEVQ